MYNIDEKFLKELLADYSRAIVGRICKQIELLEKNQTVTKEQFSELTKVFNKELIYQSFRDLESHLKAYQAGKKFVKFQIYNTPTQE